MYHYDMISARFLDISSSNPQELRDTQQELFTLLIERDKEFGFNKDIYVEYPYPVSDFLRSPVSYINERLKALGDEKGINFSRVAILTTYGDILSKSLTAEGYKENIIDMPAGPENTRSYSYNVDNNGNSTYYLEVVNEMDEKIHPSFVLTLRNANGKLIGGMSGSIWESNGERNAYIATVVAAVDAPSGVGSLATEQVLNYLIKQNVKCVNLGTQTADIFYKKHGFSVIHTIIEKIRYRISTNGTVVWHDLVIMQKNLKVDYNCDSSY